MNFRALWRFLAELEVSQGEGVGRPFTLLPWQRRALRGALAPDIRVASITLGRGGGKSTLFASVAAAAVAGPLAIPRGEVLVVAGAFSQARILFEHAKAFLDPVLQRDGCGPRGRFRVQDSPNSASIQDRKTGARLRCIGNNPALAHGLAPALVLCDEPSKWGRLKSDSMIAALRTSLGKVRDSRLVALGTRPADPDHWFSRMLAGGADYVQAHQAGKDDPPFARSTWKRANPSLDAFPELEAEIASEAAEAKRDPSMLAAFKALRLNLGTSETIQSTLLDADVWQSIEADEDLKLDEGFSLGLDLGQTAAMSAASGYWPASGRLEALAVFPEVPDLRERGLKDGVGSLYSRMADRGELLVSGRNVSNVGALLREVLKRWGDPKVIGCDRWREGELRDALEAVRFPSAALEVRGQGFKDGAIDVREFRRACLEGRVKPKKSLLLRSAMSESRVVSDDAGNEKQSKKVEGGRRSTARDDAATAAILAVAVGSRLYSPKGKRGGRVYVA